VKRAAGGGDFREDLSGKGGNPLRSVWGKKVGRGRKRSYKGENAAGKKGGGGDLALCSEPPPAA